MPVISAAAQSLQPGEFVSLFLLDATSVGGTVMPFVQSKNGASPVVFAGVSYTGVDCEFTGLETTGVGALPNPRFRIANTDGVYQNVLNTVGDLTGCKLERRRTFARYLDGQPTANPGAFYGPDEFRIERLVAENPVYIEFELSATIDQEGKMLPGRQVIRDTCLSRYRVWNGSSFDYSKVQCPYTGSTYFDINDQVVAGAANDKPSRRISCCRARFGANNPLPFGGFPGAERVR